MLSLPYWSIGLATLLASSRAFLLMSATQIRRMPGKEATQVAEKSTEGVVVCGYCGATAAPTFAEVAQQMVQKHGAQVQTIECSDEESTGIASREDYATFRLYKAGLLLDELKVIAGSDWSAGLLARVEALVSISNLGGLAQEGAMDSVLCLAQPGASYSKELAVGTYAVQLASYVSKGLQASLKSPQGGVSSISKMDSSPVTVADFTVQAIVLGVLSGCFPEDGFIAEETSKVLCEDDAALNAVVALVRRVFSSDLTAEDVCCLIDLGGRGHSPSSTRTWTNDPIDGTKGFIRGEQYCVALGMMDSGRPVVGVLGCPNLGDHVEGKEGELGEGQIFSASDNSGSYSRPMNSQFAQVQETKVGVIELRVLDASSASEARVLESVESGHSSHDLAAQVAEGLGISKPSVRMDSQAKYGCLARGQGGLYLRLPRAGYVENIWDHLAGVVVVQEAGTPLMLSSLLTQWPLPLVIKNTPFFHFAPHPGGRVTDSNGLALDFSQGAKLPKEVSASRCIKLKCICTFCKTSRASHPALSIGTPLRRLLVLLGLVVPSMMK
ncbi:unnamed protein product [Chrysoparadoxa australica]